MSTQTQTHTNTIEGLFTQQNFPLQVYDDARGTIFWVDAQRGPCLIVTDLTGAGLQRAANLAAQIGALVVPIPGQTYRVTKTVDWPDGVSCECPKRMVIRRGEIDIEWWTDAEYDRLVISPFVMSLRYPRLHGAG